MRHDTILNRFTGAPESSVNMVNHWHMWQPGETVDAIIEDPNQWAKGRHPDGGSYPVNWEGLDERADNAKESYWGYRYSFGDGKPLALEMEIGPWVFNYRHKTDRHHLAHIGRVVRDLGGVDHVYGHGWDDLGWRDDEVIKHDLATYTLIGCPERLAISCYGEWSAHWGSTHGDKIQRARRLADAITYKEVRPLLYISPYVAGKGRMELLNWYQICVATLTVCTSYDCDALMWLDGGRDREPYVNIRKYHEMFEEVFA